MANMLPFRRKLSMPPLVKELRLQLTSSLILFAYSLVGIIFPNYRIPVNYYLYLVAGLVCWACIQLYVKENHKNKILEREFHQRPIEMTVDILEIKRTAINMLGNDSWFVGHFHVFVRLDLDLKLPQRVNVTGCRAQFVHSSGSISGTQYTDLSDWHFFNKPELLGYPIDVLPTNIYSGAKEQGWVHFITEECTKEHIDSSNVRVTVYAGNWAATGETKQDAIWYINSNIDIVRGLPEVAKHNSDVLVENEALWLGSDEIWRFKKPHKTARLTKKAYECLIQSPLSSVAGCVQKIHQDSLDTQSGQHSTDQ